MRCTILILVTAVAAAVSVEPATAQAAAADPLVVYCGRSETLAAPVFTELERNTGIRVEAHYAGSKKLQQRVVAEGGAGRADLLWLRDAGYLGWLADGEWLEPLPADLRAETDPRFDDPEGFWVGISGRMRVLVRNKLLGGSEQPPRSLTALAAGQKRGRLGWVPSGESFQAHISALRHAWGNSETSAWLKRMKKLEPKAYPNDSDLLQAVTDGTTAWGWVDYAATTPFMKPGTPLAISSFADGDMGNLLSISGAAVRKGTPHKREALHTLRFLLGDWTQRYLAERAHEYPARTGMAASDPFSLPRAFHPSFVDARSLVDTAPTRAMLKELALP